MKTSKLLILDAMINFVLGVLLLLSILFPTQITEILGVPKIQHAFYPSILGGVLIGVGIALLLESSRHQAPQMIGLGLGGAIAINLCGGLVLMGWLVFGNLALPVRGQLFLWLIALSLVGISSVEWWSSKKPEPKT